MKELKIKSNELNFLSSSTTADNSNIIADIPHETIN
jgi:hypothetical protein